MESVDTLADGAKGVHDVGFVEYFELFYDNVPHRDDEQILRLSTLSSSELSALTKLRDVVDDACDATPSEMDEGDFVASGWPENVRIVAEKLVLELRSRGRFSEDVEQNEPD